MESIVNIGIFTLITLAFGSVIASFFNAKSVYLLLKSNPNYVHKPEVLRAAFVNLFHTVMAVGFLVLAYFIIYTLIQLLVAQAITLVK